MIALYKKEFYESKPIVEKAAISDLFKEVLKSMRIIN